MGLKRSFKPTNIVTNSNFAKGTTGWTTGVGSLTAANNILSIPTTAAANNNYCAQSYTFVAGKKYYARVKARVTNADCTDMSLRASSTVFTNLVPTVNTWYTLSGVITGANETSIRGRHQYADSAAGRFMEVQEFIVIDLSAQLPATLLALSNAALKVWCDANIPAWFEGTLSGGSFGGAGGLH